ncbi:hypothetical protein L810_2639 [Burkholderia sp. AU4i]|nr:hypothetical protein L810_2639 [Burkholderia sp. AU4i]
MGTCPTDTDLFHEPGENGGNQTCYYNGFSRPSFGAPGLGRRWQQGGACAGKAAAPRGSGWPAGRLNPAPTCRPPSLPGRWS